MLRRIRRWLAPASDGGRIAATAGDASTDPLRAIARTQRKLSIRLDEVVEELGHIGAQVKLVHRELTARLDRKAEAPRARNVLTHAADPSGPSTGPSTGPALDNPSYDDVLDALDRLDDARAMLPTDGHALAGGLEAIASHLARHLSTHGVRRHAAIGGPPDGRRFRVVDTEQRTDVPDGVVVRVVRSAASRDDRIVREGEVIVSRSSPRGEPT